MIWLSHPKLYGYIFWEYVLSGNQNKNMKNTLKCQKLQFLKWPLEAGSKSESIPTDSKKEADIVMVTSPIGLWNAVLKP